MVSTHAARITRLDQLSSGPRGAIACSSAARSSRACAPAPRRRRAPPPSARKPVVEVVELGLRLERRRSPRRIVQHEQGGAGSPAVAAAVSRPTPSSEGSVPYEDQRPFCLMRPAAEPRPTPKPICRIVGGRDERGRLDVHRGKQTIAVSAAIGIRPCASINVDRDRNVDLGVIGSASACRPRG